MTTDDQQLSLSRSEARQRLYDLVKIGAIACGSAINPAAPLAIELVSSLIRGPVEKHRQQVIEGILDRLERLEESGRINWENLSRNETFSAITLQAVQIAGQTREKEKREYLRNAALNAALDQTIPEIETSIFMDLLHRYTALHVHCLKQYTPTENAESLSWFTDSQLESIGHGSRLPGLDKALIERIPVLSENAHLGRMIHRAFESDGLVITLLPNVDSPSNSFGLIGRSNTPGARTSAESIITELGKSFLDFLSDPTE